MNEDFFLDLKAVNLKRPDRERIKSKLSQKLITFGMHGTGILICRQLKPFAADNYGLLKF